MKVQYSKWNRRFTCSAYLAFGKVAFKIFHAILIDTRMRQFGGGGTTSLPRELIWCAGCIFGNELRCKCKVAALRVPNSLIIVILCFLLV